MKKPTIRSVEFSMAPFLRILKISGIGKTQPIDGTLGDIVERFQAFLFIVGAACICYVYFVNFPEDLESKNVVTRMIPHIDFILVCLSFFLLYFEGLLTKKSFNSIIRSFDKIDTIMEKDFGISCDLRRSEKTSTQLVIVAFALQVFKLVFNHLFVGNLGWQRRFYIILYAFTSGLFSIMYFLLLTIFWQINLRFKKMTEYIRFLERNKMLKIRIDKLSQICVSLNYIIDRTNGIFGLYQLFFIGEKRGGGGVI